MGKVPRAGETKESENRIREARQLDVKTEDGRGEGAGAEGREGNVSEKRQRRVGMGRGKPLRRN